MITKIKKVDIDTGAMIDPVDCPHQYFNWKEIGDHSTRRALELKNKMRG